MVHNILKSLKDSVQKLKRFRVEEEWEEPVQPAKNPSLVLKLRIKYCRDLVGSTEHEHQTQLKSLDPFVNVSMIKKEKVSYGELLEKYGKTYSTDVAFQTNNPHFEEDFQIPVQNYKQDLISLSVYNDTKVSVMRARDKLKQQNNQLVASLEASTDVASSSSTSSFSNEQRQSTDNSLLNKKKALRRVRIGKVIIPCPGKLNVLKEEVLQLDPNGGTLHIEYMLCNEQAQSRQQQQ